MSDALDVGNDAPVSNESDQTAATPENVATPAGDTQSQPDVKPAAEKTLTQSEVDAIVQKEKAKAEAKAERRYLRQQRELLERFVPKPEPAPQQAAEAGKPKLSDYPDFESFMEARDAWIEKRTEAKFEEKLKTTTKQSAEESARAKAESAWQEKLKKAAKEFPDWEDVQELAPDLRVPPAMEAALMEADNGPRILRHLALNPDEAERIASLSPARQAAAILKMDEAPVPKVSNAPAPLTPVGGNRGGGTKDPVDMTDAEFADWRRKQIKARS